MESLSREFENKSNIHYRSKSEVVDSGGVSVVRMDC